MNLTDDQQLALREQLEVSAEDFTLELFNKYYRAYERSSDDAAVIACYQTIRSLVQSRISIPEERLRELVHSAHDALGLTSPEDDEVTQGLAADLLRMVLRCADNQIARLTDKSQGGVAFVRRSIRLTPIQTGDAKPTGPSIAQVAAEYRQVRVSGGEQHDQLREKEIANLDRMLRVFVHHFDGARVIGTIRAEELANFVELLCQLPTGFHEYLSGSGEHGGALSLQDVIDQKEEGDTTRARSTVIRDVMHLRGLFAFAGKSRSYVDGVERLQDALKVRKDEDAIERRDVLEAPLLSRMFGADYLSLCRGRAERYWLPLVMLHTGMRPTEIAQLYCDNIEFDEATGRYWINCVRDTKRGQSLKTKSSMRAIPIHQWLVSNGFIEFVKMVAESGAQQLFPRLWQTKGYQLSGPVCKWFMDSVLRPLESSPSIVLYSMRHTVAGVLRQHGASSEEIGRLLGHSSGHAITEHYGRGNKPAKLPSVMSLVDRLDWSQELTALAAENTTCLNFSDSPTTSKEQ